MKIPYIFIATSVSIFGIFLYLTYAVEKIIEEEQYGTVIVLQAPSEIDVAAMLEEFQMCMSPHCWIPVSLCQVCEKLYPNNADFLQTREGQKVIHGLHAAITAYVRSGCDVIVDCSNYTKEWLEDLCAQLTDTRIHWITVTNSMQSDETHVDMQVNYENRWNSYVFDISAHSPIEIAHEIQKLV